jgi:hypothetical protein
MGYSFSGAYVRKMSVTIISIFLSVEKWGELRITEVILSWIVSITVKKMFWVRGLHRFASFNPPLQKKFMKLRWSVRAELREAQTLAKERPTCSEWIAPLRLSPGLRMRLWMIMIGKPAKTIMQEARFPGNFAGRSEGDSRNKRRPGGRRYSFMRGGSATTGGD